MGKELEGKAALVTGASRGLGKGIALRLAEMGACVAVNYRSNDEEADNTVKEIRQSGGEADCFKADVSDSAAVRDMIKRITDKWNKIDILVNNAGITRDILLPRMTEENWDSVIDINLRGAYLCTRFALRSMMNQPWGRIINISSLAGIHGNEGQANYSAAKGGLIAFTKSVARELGSRNITANVIAPGFFLTDMTSKLSEEIRNRILERIPIKRFGNIQDIAELAGFLAGEKSSYITAQVICVDGGVL
jgi:3-oxoacyl-[acyl-carrier protein] reductase